MPSLGLLYDLDAFSERVLVSAPYFYLKVVAAGLSSREFLRRRPPAALRAASEGQRRLQQRLRWGSPPRQHR